MAYHCLNRPDRKADVLMTLHDSDWMTNKELAEEIGCNEQNIRNVTRTLVNAGRIESRPDIRHPCRREFREVREQQEQNRKMEADD